MHMKYILGSGSPRRRELLGMILPEFTVMPSRFGEESMQRDGLDAGEIVCALSREKAREVFIRCREENPQQGICVIGGDTIVVSPDGEVMGKPTCRADAARMLRSLSGRPHRVYTGYCLRGPSVDRSGHAVTEVFFNDLSDEWIAGYVATGSPLDKAGAYGIQDDARLVRRVCGSYTNVVGLPEEEIRARLAELGVLS